VRLKRVEDCISKHQPRSALAVSDILRLSLPYLPVGVHDEFFLVKTKKVSDTRELRGRESLKDHASDSQSCAKTMK
jgi:hypothetical protein